MSILKDIKELPKLKADLAEAQAKLEGFEALEASLQESLSETKAANDKVAEITSKLTELETAKASLSAEFEAYKADEGKRNAAYAAGLVAATGIDPLKAKAKATESGVEKQSARAAWAKQFTK